MSEYWVGFDLEESWLESDYVRQEYTGAPVTYEQVAEVERELGYKLPASDIEFIHPQPGVG
jgi:hypothetical protein